MTRTAAQLARRAARRWPLIRRHAGAGLWFLTDPLRTPDPVAVAAALPRGAVVVYRAFGDPAAAAVAVALRVATRRAGVTLLIGADAALARKVGADGVHLPQRLAHTARRLRRAHPHWLVTAAAHGPAAILKGEASGAQILLISAVFASASPSAGRPLGTVRFAALRRMARCPVIALGGVNARTARRLCPSRAAGLASVEALANVGSRS
jgi:thiamine-phosphate pyrophosphorylase